MNRRDLFKGTMASGLSLEHMAITRAAFANIDLPHALSSIYTSGFSAPEDRGSGALYIKSRGKGLLGIQDKQGNWWNLSIGAEIWAGWFGALGLGDDTKGVQAAIDYAASRPDGGVVHIAAGTYRIAETSGKAEIGAHDDGTLPQGAGGSLDPEPVEFQAYCLRLPPKVKLIGESGTKFIGNYVYGRASENEKICIALTDDHFHEWSAIDGISFEKYFIAIASLKSWAVTLGRYTNLRFSDCAIGFYAASLERCYFDLIESYRTGCAVVVGGQWFTRRDNYFDQSGYADKTFFGVFHNIYQRVMGADEQTIDSYFDEKFYKTANTDSRLGPPKNKSSVVRTSRYLGICGRVIYIMTRYARPSNANIFRLISHAYAPRAAIWIDHSSACAADVVYLEGCGYRDSQHRIGAIGEAFTDPYLGPGVRPPAFVKGVSCRIDAQFVHAEALSLGNEFADDIRFESDIRNPQNARRIPSPLVTDSIETTANQSILGGLMISTVKFSKGVTPTLFRTAAHTRASSAALVIVSTKNANDESASASAYMLSIVDDPLLLQNTLVAGPDVVEFNISADGFICISTRSDTSFGSAAFFGL